MFIHLVESRRRRERSFGGTALSTVAHVVIGVFLIYETATANPHARARPDETVRPVFVPSKPDVTPPHPSRPDRRPCTVCNPIVQPVVGPVVTPSLTGLPNVDTDPQIVAGDFGTPSVSGIYTNTTAHGDGTPMDPAFVERNALPLRSNAPPRYPEMLRSTSVEGRVVMQFVVDTLGRVEEPSIREIASTNVLFASAARDALLRWRFTPAESGEHKVRVRLEQPFDFKLTR